MRIANALTLSRLAIIPIIVVAFYVPGALGRYIAAFLFALGAITDYFDGYVARRFNEVSKFGAFLDPVVDKLMVVIVLVLLASSVGKLYLTLPVLVIVGREFIISALREWMAEIGKRTSVAVGAVGKVKTTMQMAAILLLLAYNPALSKWWYILGISLLYVAVVLTLWSMVMYLKAAWSDLTFSV